MVDIDKINIGHKKVKQLSGGIHENLAMLRKAINHLYEELDVEKPSYLEELNALFEDN